MNVHDALLESRACEDEVVNATRTSHTKGHCDHQAQHRRRRHHRPPEQALRSYQKVKQATSDRAKGSQDAVVPQQEDHVAGRHHIWHGVGGRNRLVLASASGGVWVPGSVARRV
eukprot:scaffold12581_cov49-Phaeocystis_antarctica.AAC.3